MLSEILSPANLQEALDHLLTKGDTCGIDGMMLSQLPDYLALNGSTLAASVQNGTFIPQPVVLFEKLGRNGRVRTLAKFSSIDRLLLRAIQQRMDGALEKTFSPNSFAYRKNRGTLEAVKLAAEYIQQGKIWVTELDIHQYFDSIPHAPLLQLLGERFQEEAFIALLEKYLTIPVMKEGTLSQNKRGVIQGNPISPLLGNLYLDSLDHFCAAQGFFFPPLCG